MIKQTMGTAPGTHPSFASSCTVLQCDRCDRTFRADSCVDDRWELHGEIVGAHDDAAGIDWPDLCVDCHREINEDS